jgi:hypothetical protein
MLRSTSLLRNVARLALLLPFALPATGCGDDVQSSAPGDAGAGSEAGSGTDSGGGGGTDSGNGGTGMDGGNGTDGGTDGSVTPDTTPPTVTGNLPATAAVNVASTAVISVDFSEPMAAATIEGAGATTFTVTKGGVAVAGTVSYFDDTATFVPTGGLDLNSTYTATISTAATDVAGNALAAPFTWTFMTDTTAPLGPAPVLLGAAGKYVILGESAITNVPTSHVTGNVGISPAAASYITGFVKTKAGTYWTAPEVVGRIFAADNDKPTPGNLTTAVGAMMTAYTDAATRPPPNALNFDGSALGTTPIVPGLYNFTGNVTIPNNVSITGGPNDVFIFQVNGKLTMSAMKSITLTGARAKNVFWQVTGAIDIGAGSHFEGIILAKTNINLQTGASITGRLYAQTAVTIASSTVGAPAP